MKPTPSTVIALLGTLLLAACGTEGSRALAGSDGGATTPDPNYSCDTPAVDNPWLERAELNFSHRGGALEFPENTLYAYQRSVDVGADVLEMDVYETADGELVVIHDATVTVSYTHLTLPTKA